MINRYVKTITLAVIAVVLLGGFASVVHSDDGDGSVWFGFAGGRSDDEALGRCDNAWKVYAGGMKADRFGVEAGYVDLGTPEDATVDFDQSALYAAIISNLPVGERFAFSTKVGWSAWRVDIKGTGDDNDHTGSDWMWGVGAKAYLTDAWTASLEYEQFTDIAEADVSFVSIGFAYRM